MKHILVTGGAGYIGSHVVVELVQAGYEPVILDSFDNADHNAITHLETLLKRKLTVYDAAFQNVERLLEIITKESITGVVHIAAFKAVGESVAQPLKYYQNNVAGFVTLLETLQAAKVTNLVFSSSAAVYGTPPTDLVTEDTICKPESPYGWTKYMDEIMLRDLCQANPQVKGVALRYFNVVGSHPSALIGESPKGKPQNLLPIIVKAVAENVPFTVYGTDYPTPDGTCQRDYVHVVDLARAHVAALASADRSETTSNYHVYNIGTGKPTSVLELIHAFERINGVSVPYQLGARRAGDPVACYASAKKAHDELGWQAGLTIEDAVRSAWQWAQHTRSDQ